MNKYYLIAFFLLSMLFANVLFADIGIMIRDLSDTDRRAELKSLFFRPEPIELSGSVLFGIGGNSGYSFNQGEAFKCLNICKTNIGQSNEFQTNIQGFFFEYYLFDNLGLGFRRVEVVTDSDIDLGNNDKSLSGIMTVTTPTIQWFLYTSDSLETRIGIMAGSGKASRDACR